MSIDYDAALKIAKLSRVKLTRVQTDKIVEELSEVLKFVQKLEEVDTSCVSPLNMVNTIEPQKRSDKVEDGNYREKILKNAPNVKEGFFSVPKVVE